MKKHSFIESTLISTIAIIIVKIFGLIYVIPFYAIVGVKGAALYAYAYTIYGLFLEISTAGIPNAIGKIVNEYNTLKLQEAKIRAYRLGRQLLLYIALVAFVIMFFFAKPIATLILGDLSGGNTIEDVAFVIRCVSFALLIFPFLSVTRGFFQGHKYIYVSSISQVIEQFVRVLFIVVGSYVALNFLHLSLTHVVGVAVFSAFIGGGFALLYVLTKLRKNKKELGIDEKYSKNDNISNKEIFKKIIKYAIPTVIVSIAFSIYNNVDMILILRTMNHLGFSASDVEFITTAISTWASKISIIVTSIGLGMAPSLVASMVEAYTLKDYKEVNHKFNKGFELTIFITIPMVVGISLLSSSIWSIFYGYSNLGGIILSMCIFCPLFTNLFTITNFTLQSMNKFKTVYICSISGIILNALLDIPLMLLCNLIGIPAYFGATFASIIGFSVAILAAMLLLKKEYKFHYGEILKTLLKSVVPLVSMILVVILLKMIVPLEETSRISNIIYVAIISLIGAIVYLVISYYMGIVSHVFGEDFLSKLKRKLRLKKKEG